MSQSTMYLLSIVGGIVPALVWLWFWLKEDGKRPEPTRRIVITFLAGMLAAGVAIPFEYVTEKYFGYSIAIIFFSWSVIEEVLKLLASYFAALRTRLFDEPIDAPIYLLTAALGFAALENVFFLLTLFLQDGNVVDGLLLGNFRFIGATLLHILASAVVGITIALAYYRSRLERIMWAVVGLSIAITLHTGFNYLIIESNTTEKLATFALVWISIIIILLFFERVKRLTKEHHDITT